MGKLTQEDVIRKCLVVFEALRRRRSRGNAGLEPQEGMEDAFWEDDEICAVLREMIREIQAGKEKKEETDGEEPEMREWQKDIMENGIPERLRIL